MSDTLLGLGRREEALEVFARIHALDETDLANLNNYAWALATLPNEDLRDGPKAARLARLALSQLKEPDPAYLDTLGAALAEIGDFEGAVEAEAEAIRLAEAGGRSEKDVQKLRAHLKMLESGRPIRDPAF
jgi:tetratricopeptide (TPR) repeat protein